MHAFDSAGRVHTVPFSLRVCSGKPKFQQKSSMPCLAIIAALQKVAIVRELENCIVLATLQSMLAELSLFTHVIAKFSKEMLSLDAQ